MSKSKKKCTRNTKTIPVYLHPIHEQVALLNAHYAEYIRTINVLVPALDADLLPDNAVAFSL